MVDRQWFLRFIWAQRKNDRIYARYWRSLLLQLLIVKFIFREYSRQSTAITHYFPWKFSGKVNKNPVIFRGRSSVVPAVYMCTKEKRSNLCLNWHAPPLEVVGLIWWSAEARALNTPPYDRGTRPTEPCRSKRSVKTIGIASADRLYMFTFGRACDRPPRRKQLWTVHRKTHTDQSRRRLVGRLHWLVIDAKIRQVSLVSRFVTVTE